MTLGANIVRVRPRKVECSSGRRVCVNSPHSCPDVRQIYSRSRPGLCTILGMHITDRSTFCALRKMQQHWWQAVKTLGSAYGRLAGGYSWWCSCSRSSRRRIIRLLDEATQTDLPTTYCNFTDHTLPVTDIVCGVGAFPSCRILTSSVDHTVKVRFRSSIYATRFFTTLRSYGTLLRRLS